MVESNGCSQIKIVFPRLFMWHWASSFASLCIAFSSKTPRAHRAYARALPSSFTIFWLEQHMLLVLVPFCLSKCHCLLEYHHPVSSAVKQDVVICDVPNNGGPLLHYWTLASVFTCSFAHGTTELLTECWKNNICCWKTGITLVCVAGHWLCLFVCLFFCWKNHHGFELEKRHMHYTPTATGLILLKALEAYGLDCVPRFYATNGIVEILSVLFASFLHLPSQWAELAGMIITLLVTSVSHNIHQNHYHFGCDLKTVGWCHVVYPLKLSSHVVFCCWIDALQCTRVTVFWCCRIM